MVVKGGLSRLATLRSAEDLPEQLFLCESVLPNARWWPSAVEALPPFFCEPRPRARVPALFRGVAKTDSRGRVRIDSAREAFITYMCEGGGGK